MSTYGDWAKLAEHMENRNSRQRILECTCILVVAAGEFCDSLASLSLATDIHFRRDSLTDYLTTDG